LVLDFRLARFYYRKFGHYFGSSITLHLFRWFFKESSFNFEHYLALMCIGYLEGKEQTCFSPQRGKFVNFMRQN